jgi:hypothetical protein
MILIRGVIGKTAVALRMFVHLLQSRWIGHKTDLRTVLADSGRPDPQQVRTEQSINNYTLKSLIGKVNREV